MIKAYDKLHWVVRILLAFFLGYFISGIYRIVKGLDKSDTVMIVVGIVHFFIPILWLIDLITVIIWNKYLVIA